MNFLPVCGFLLPKHKEFSWLALSHGQVEKAHITLCVFHGRGMISEERNVSPGGNVAFFFSFEWRSILINGKSYIEFVCLQARDVMGV